MTGMQAKSLRRRHAARFTADGLPRDAREWTEATKEIGERHTENKP